MSKPSRTTLFQRLGSLERIRDDIPQEEINRIISGKGERPAKYEVEELLFRMAVEIQISRLKKKLGYQQ